MVNLVCIRIVQLDLPNWLLPPFMAVNRSLLLSALIFAIVPLGRTVSSSTKLYIWLAHWLMLGLLVFLHRMRSHIACSGMKDLLRLDIHRYQQER